MVKRYVTRLIIAAFMTFSLLSVSYADIIVSKRTGNIRFTMPDDTAITISPKDDIPRIPADGVAIEVLSGSAIISVTGASTVTIKIGKSFARLNPGDALKIDMDAKTVELISGPIDFVNSDGTITSLNENEPVAHIIGTAEKEMVVVPEEPAEPERVEGSPHLPR